jgi:hypothetical protein
MLTKQWQMGEFRGSDAGSPVFAKLQIDTTRLTKYQPDAQAAQLFEYGVPLEAKVECRPLPPVSSDGSLGLDIRLAMGRQWLALIQGIGPYRNRFIAAYPIAVPDPTKKEEADRCAHPEVWEMFTAVSGRAMDGAALYAYLQDNPSNHAYDGIAVLPGDRSPIDDAAVQFLAWFERWLLQPLGGDDAWIPERLEYQFSASAPQGDAEKVYAADAYYQGRLDWYSVDVDVTRTTLGAVTDAADTGLPPTILRTMIPTPVSFAGMPNTRWWSFEDRKTNFGDIDAGTTDLAKLLFLEFALVYANDWFVIPYTLPGGAIATIRGCAVTNTFGERLWINSADSGPDSDWQRWSMFTINVGGREQAAADTSLLLLPTVPKVQESAPWEDVMLVRDESANMVWAVETAIPLATGDPKDGLEAARQLRSFLEQQLAARIAGGAAPAPPLPAVAAIRYQAMSTVPENWVPFIPVHIPGNNRKIQLQRAAMPRILETDPEPPIKIRPRTPVMREGLDVKPAKPYFVHEEETPRAGARVLGYFERTRWTDGRVYTWLRLRKQTGRGEGSSGLAFDEIIPVPRKAAS